MKQIPWNKNLHLDIVFEVVFEFKSNLVATFLAGCGCHRWQVLVLQHLIQTRRYQGGLGWV